ncbi:hypothetical protein FNJ88_03985 [Chryseobacterium sp. SNU WT5]|uniref:hypothetical protein n=1 Tax=Chryseobacterium sp. SNU WT5 TaxID=2594269 RepID=UPI0011813053|nr:hypothetical protein [Chryseobacterium sp. SNU WT5]QDP84751.1 hypothetical protein FNJ88_03985 [Chryseobacterium sp. SNU WT5]
MKIKINSLISVLFFILIIINCSSQKTTINNNFNGKIDKQFEAYLRLKNIPFKELNDSIYSAHFSKFLDDELKQKLVRNPYLKINKVYMRHITPTSVEFSIYSDKGTFCISTFDLKMDGKTLSFPENGVVKILEPIQVEDFGDFKIENNIIKTRKRQKSPFRETYYYVNGTIKNDTISFTEKYIGKEHKFEKKLFAKTRKVNKKEVYQPALKVVQYKVGKFLVSYEVTGEFRIEK